MNNWEWGLGCGRGDTSGNRAGFRLCLAGRRRFVVIHILVFLFKICTPQLQQGFAYSNRKLPH